MHTIAPERRKQLLWRQLNVMPACQYITVPPPLISLDTPFSSLHATHAFSEGILAHSGREGHGEEVGRLEELSSDCSSLWGYRSHAPYSWTWGSEWRDIFYLICFDLDTTSCVYITVTAQYLLNITCDIITIWRQMHDAFKNRGIILTARGWLIPLGIGGGVSQTCQPIHSSKYLRLKTKSIKYCLHHSWTRPTTAGCVTFILTWHIGKR